MRTRATPNTAHRAVKDHASHREIMSALTKLRLRDTHREESTNRDVSRECRDALDMAIEEARRELYDLAWTRRRRGETTTACVRRVVREAILYAAGEAYDAELESTGDLLLAMSAARAAIELDAARRRGGVL